MVKRTWNETQAGTDSGATATHAAVSGSKHFVTCISGHTDADSLIQILGGSAGATVLWESKIDVSLNGTMFHFPGLWIEGDTGVKVAGKVASSTADCQVNLQGETIP